MRRPIPVGVFLAGLVVWVGLACSPWFAKLPDFAVNTYPEVKIIEKSGGIGPCEPSIAINPLNPKEMVVGAVINHVARSSDGGRSWELSTISSTHGVWGDPVLLADYVGNFFYLHLSDPSGKNWGDTSLLDRIVIQKSSDGGQSWSDGSFAGYAPPKDQDKPWGAVNPLNNHLYLSWTEYDRYGSKDPGHRSRILFARSTDGGESWSDPVKISRQEGDCISDDQTAEGSVPAVGPAGEIYISWAFDEQILFDRSFDGGQTWLEEDILVAAQPGGWNFRIPGLNRSNGLPVTVCDHSSGKFSGNLYVVWADQRNGETDTDIWVSRSSDRGEHWSEPLRINDDAPGRHNFLPWATVDPVSGYLYVVYYDRRNHSDDHTDVYLAVSKDGGNSFYNIRISQRPFLPYSTLFFGDYNNIAAWKGTVRPVWTRYEKGKLSIWTALIEVR